MTRKNNPENFQAAQLPFKTPEEADGALQSFWDELYELRNKYSIANVTLVVKDSISNSGDFMWSAFAGNETEEESMAAWHFGRASAARQDLVRRAVDAGAQASIALAEKRK